MFMDKVQSHFGYFRSTFKNLTHLDLPMTVKDRTYNAPINEELVQNSWSVRQMNEYISTPSDLVSLAWLQKGDILQIAPLDGEDEQNNDLGSSTASFTSLKNDDLLNNYSMNSQFESLNPPLKCISPPSEPNISFPVVSNLQRPASVNSEQLSSYELEAPRYSSINGQGLSKPNYSYTHLIFMAIESTTQKCMTVNQIYNWCESNFPFYKHAGAGWKNSLRHNLSINKSFKRLPRDSRNESYVYVNCHNVGIFSSQGPDYSDADDDEGPGRGAFWTVEPRERPVLLDAIKRNPWNFTNISLLNSNQSDGMNQNSINAVHQYNLKRFGLARSAPGQLLRSEGMSQMDGQIQTLDKLNGIINAQNGSIRILYASDGKVIASCDNGLVRSNVLYPNDLSNEIIDLQKSCSMGYIFPDSRYWSSPLDETASTDGATAEVVWPAEEEEKYLSTIRLLTESDEIDAPDLNHNKSNQLVQSDLPESKSENNEEDIKLVTKQRRKSRLQPTRITDETYINSMVGKCNECKENASGCESCQTKRYRLLNDPRFQNSFKDCSLIDVSNTLDSDQEHGPAGGPAVKPRNNLRSQPRAKQQNGIDGHDFDVTQKSANRHDNDNNPDSIVDNVGYNLAFVESNEVYLTPAPYIDHEYSHCQAQLRHPEENDVVDRYNENYRIQKIKSLIKFHPLFRGSVDAKLLDMGADATYRTNHRNIRGVNSDDVDIEEDDEEVDEDGDEIDEYSDMDYHSVANGFSSDDQDAYYGGDDRIWDMRFGGIKRHVNKDLNGDENYSNFNGYKRSRNIHRGRVHRMRTGTMRKTQRITSNHNVRGRRRSRGSKINLSASLTLNAATRRSKRVIKAPRRLYDDFEQIYGDENDEEYQSQFIENNDVSLFAHDNDDPKSKKRRYISREYFCNGSNNYSNSDVEVDSFGFNNSANHRMRHKKVNHKLLSNQSDDHHGFPDADENMDVDDDYEEDDDEEGDEEANYLRNASKLQLINNRSEKHLRDKSRGDRVANPNNSIQHNSSDMANVWNTWQWSMEQKKKNKMNKEKWTNRVVPEEDEGYDVDELCDEEEVDHISEVEDGEREIEEYKENVINGIDAKTGERTTVEAAHLLLGISQMQSFRRQSGYLSLDSSGASPTLTLSQTKQSESGESSPPSLANRTSPNNSSSPIKT